jgi:TRAP-type C4-dicarboxylate transport system permease large subunit
VVFGVIAGVSIGRLFVAGFIPGVIMGLVMSIFVYFQSKHRGYPKISEQLLGNSCRL